MSDRTWWWFQDEVYWENDGLDADEVRALILERKAKMRKRIERADVLYASAAAPPRPDPVQAAEVSGREVIPDDVKMFVWQRDGSVRVLHQVTEAIDEKMERSDRNCDGGNSSAHDPGPPIARCCGRNPKRYRLLAEP
jgi:hypothetical protein